MRLTIQISIDSHEEDVLLRMYRDSIASLAEVAAGVQQYPDDDFRSELRNESVLKLIGRDDTGHPQALCLAATDLSTVPWISPAFFASRFPDEYGRHAILYVSAIVVQPDRRGLGFAQLLMRELTRIGGERNGMVAFDTCEVNGRLLPELAHRVARRFARTEPVEVDAQRFFVFHGEVDLESFDTDDREIDLRTRVEREGGVDPASTEQLIAPEKSVHTSDRGSTQ